MDQTTSSADQCSQTSQTYKIGSLLPDPYLFDFASASPAMPHHLPASHTTASAYFACHHPPALHTLPACPMPACHHLRLPLPACHLPLPACHACLALPAAYLPATYHLPACTHTTLPTPATFATTLPALPAHTMPPACTPCTHHICLPYPTCLAYPHTLYLLHFLPYLCHPLHLCHLPPPATCLPVPALPHTTTSPHTCLPTCIPAVTMTCLFLCGRGGDIASVAGGLVPIGIVGSADQDYG